jgi:hypothetical protein
MRASNHRNKVVNPDLLATQSESIIDLEFRTYNPTKCPNIVTGMLSGLISRPLSMRDSELPQ